MPSVLRVRRLRGRARGEAGLADDLRALAGRLRVVGIPRNFDAGLQAPARASLPLLYGIAYT
jgi:hypothetical protein